MIETYWNEVFGKYKTKSGKFEIPGFPEPLMSAHFGVQNLIGLGEGKRFYLCEFPELNSGEFNIGVEKLNQVGEEFRNFQDNHESYPFIKKLIPFLNGLQTPHYHFFLMDEEGISASSIAGEASCGVFLFNLIVREDVRGKGLARYLTQQMRAYFKFKKCFYWTIHPGFFFDSIVKDYYLSV